MSIDWNVFRVRVECVAALLGTDASDLLAMSNAELDEAPEVTAFARRTGASLDWLVLGKHQPFVEGRGPVTLASSADLFAKLHVAAIGVSDFARAALTMASVAEYGAGDDTKHPLAIEALEVTLEVVRNRAQALTNSIGQLKDRAEGAALA